jgi:hypothetical protein
VFACFAYLLSHITIASIVYDRIDVPTPALTLSLRCDWRLGLYFSAPCATAVLLRCYWCHNSYFVDLVLHKHCDPCMISPRGLGLAPVAVQLRHLLISTERYVSSIVWTETTTENDSFANTLRSRLTHDPIAIIQTDPSKMRVQLISLLLATLVSIGVQAHVIRGTKSP